MYEVIYVSFIRIYIYIYIYIIYYLYKVINTYQVRNFANIKAQFIFIVNYSCDQKLKV